MALTITPYTGQGWTDNSTPDLSAETLNAVDAGITANSNAINAIANAVVSQIVNDPNKIASMAALYAVNSNLANKVNTSDLTVTQIDIAQYKNAAVVSTTSNCFARSDKYKVIIDIGLALISQSLSADNVTIFTLPANIRPNLPVYFTLTATDSSISVNCSIKSDGSIVVSKTPSTAKYLSGQAIFFIGK